MHSMQPRAEVPGADEYEERDDERSEEQGARGPRAECCPAAAAPAYPKTPPGPQAARPIERGSGVRGHRPSHSRRLLQSQRGPCPACRGLAKTRALPSAAARAVPRTVAPSASALPSSPVPQRSEGHAVGRGTVCRYTVQVEDGIGVDPAAAAGPGPPHTCRHRGWTRDGLQLVASSPYDFTVKIASPATVDRICGIAGLNTRGGLNCSVGRQVVANSTRWNTGSQQFTGPWTTIGTDHQPTRSAKGSATATKAAPAPADGHW
ncbi:DUF3152 domain-containing protein [Streptomyces sp. R11]|uniref:DUF3152 domain-containing protein n=1 Tax=Streptomyces sp. R11 TaxID=3238625 RepID=A0AB39NFZ7_9ACTN